MNTIYEEFKDYVFTEKVPTLMAAIFDKYGHSVSKEVFSYDTNDEFYIDLDEAVIKLTDKFKNYGKV